jgi:hypothetical protein
MRLSMTLTISLLLWRPAFAAQACDPNAILRNDVTSYQSNTVGWLSYIDNPLRNTNSNNRGGLNLSFAGISMSLDEANSVAQYVSQQKQYILSQQQTVSVLRSTLSPDSVKAYIACLGADRGVSITIPDAALTEPAFQFGVDWDPKFAAGEDKLSLVATNGTIVGDSNVLIKPTESRIFIMTNRDLTKTVFIAAQVHGQTDIVSLPPVPQFAIKARVRSSDQFGSIRDGGHGTSLVGADVCIAADTDSILIPSTMKAVVSRVGPVDRSPTTITPGNVRSVCGHWQASTGANEITVSINGHFEVDEIYLESLK